MEPGLNGVRPTTHHFGESEGRRIVASAGAAQKIALVVVLMIALIAANVFTAHFIRRERYLYFWDWVEYWEKVTRLRDDMAENPARMVKRALSSVRTKDYNDLPALLLLPASVLLGRDRVAYILSIVDVFGLAAVVSLALVHMKIARRSGYGSPIVPVIAVGVVLLSPNFWDPILRGYPDVGGVAMTSLILLLYFKSTTSGWVSKRDAVLTALLVPMPILFRRWYAYWAVSFYVAVFVDQVFRLVARRFQVADRRLLLGTMVQAAISVIVLAVAAPKFVVRSVTTSYADIYSAYRFSHTLLGSAAHLLSLSGLVAFSLFIAGALQSIADSATRRFGMLLLVQCCVIFLLFSRTQDFGSHHFYLLLPAMLLFTALFITRLVERSRMLVASGVVAVLVLNLVTAFCPREGGARTEAVQVLTALRHPPLVRHDVAEIDRMLGVLRQRLSDRRDRVYVLASSYVLNSSMLRSAYLSLHRYQDMSDRILPTNDVDKRDGFPQGLLMARYVVVTDPIQYHLNERDQRVVGIPGELILARRGIGVSFVKLPDEFRLDTGVTAYLYERTAPFDEADLDALSATFRGYYPDRPTLYDVRRK